MKQEKFLYTGIGERLKKEWKIYLAAFLFIVIADSIGPVSYTHLDVYKRQSKLPYARREKCIASSVG